jgi:glycopeptide antibiotics resistance protein
VLLIAVVVLSPISIGAIVHDQMLAVLAWLSARGAPAWLDDKAVERIANVALFVPVGFCVGIVAGARRWWLGAVAGFVLSCGIEFAQYAFLPGRFASVWDIVTNTLGALIGAGVALLLLWLAERRERPESTPRLTND